MQKIRPEITGHPVLCSPLAKDGSKRLKKTTETSSACKPELSQNLVESPDDKRQANTKRSPQKETHPPIHRLLQWRWELWRSNLVSSCKKRKDNTSDSGSENKCYWKSIGFRLWFRGTTVSMIVDWQWSDSWGQWVRRAVTHLRGL